MATPITVRPLRLVGWISLLALAITTLDHVGGALGPLPDPSRPGTTVAWLERAGAVNAALSLVRLVALGLAWYLLVTTLVGTGARLARWRPMVRMADVVTLPRLRRFLQTTVGTGALAVAVPVGALLTPVPAATLHPLVVMVEPSPSAGDDAVPSSGPGTTSAQDTTPRRAGLPGGRIPSLDPPTMRRLADTSDATSGSSTAPPPASSPSTDPPVTQPSGPAAPGSPTAPLGPPDPAGPPQAQRVDDATPTPPTAEAASPPGTSSGPDPQAPSGSSPVADTQGPSSPEGTWRIEPGDHLWHVAEATLTHHQGRSATSAETAAYLGQIVEANRSQLAVPDNPDLVFAGQVFVLPPVGP